MVMSTAIPLFCCCSASSTVPSENSVAHSRRSPKLM
jgi:hypothetical protein